MPNRLSASSSPYLKQHEENPIDWHPWGDEAFEEAKARNLPVFISIGYSSCHWCHVMAHESFEDAAVAEFVNQNFVCIKVDREEHPDVDETYMMAVQLMTRRGGWPMTIFATPDRKPFFAGTYFPKEDRQGFPSFLNLCRQIAGLWQTKRTDVVRSAEEVAKAIRQGFSRDSRCTLSTLPTEIITECFQKQRASFDGQNGGFGTAPKFPAHSALSFLTDYAATQPGESAAEALGMVFMSLRSMALGGIHDMVGGGFCRYSTDEKWLLPHFEKMLYDNALLLQCYTRAAQIAEAIEARAEADLFENVAIGIVQWLRQEMTSPEGLFYSALDADSEGEEGKFYTWTAAEIDALLGESAAAFKQAFGVQEEGNFADEATGQPTGLNILHLTENRQAEFRRELGVLANARRSRVRPITDTKCLAAWNGMVICALAECGEIETATRAATTWLQHYRSLGWLPHQITDGEPSGYGYLDDYAWMIQALATLTAHTEDPQWIESAKELAEAMRILFQDPERGGYFFTSENHAELFGRSKPTFDQPVPSANAAAIWALMMLGQNDQATESLMAVIGDAQRAPEAAEALVHALLMLSHVPPEASGMPELEGVATAAQPLPAGKVEAKLESQELAATPDGWATGSIHVHIPEGLHLNSNQPPARWLIPTELKCAQAEMVVEYPPAANDAYEGNLTLNFKIRATSRPMEFELRLTFQACTATECQAPDERVLDGVVL